MNIVSRNYFYLSARAGGILSYALFIKINMRKTILQEH